VVGGGGVREGDAKHVVLNNEIVSTGKVLGGALEGRKMA